MQGLLDRPPKPVLPRGAPPEVRFAKTDTETALGGGGAFIHIVISGDSPLKYTDPDGEAVNLVSGGIGFVLGSAIGTAVAVVTGKSGKEIVAAAAGGAVTGVMAGLTMGGSLATQMATGALAKTAGYMAENIVNGDPHTVAGTVQNAAEGVSGKMVGDIVGKTGEVAKAAINKSHINYMLTTNPVNVAPLRVDFKDTIQTIDTNARNIDIGTEYAKQTVDVLQDIYKNKTDESK
jgi:hypothetical protein